MSEEINLGRLERELAAALEADRKYARENDAKFRAISQRVASYEEFRDIVKASHLSPLDHKEIVDSSRKQPWNPVAHGNTTGSSPSDGGIALPPSSLPSNAQEFTREWRRLKQRSPDQQYQFLVGIGGEWLLEIFKVEISMGLLGEILTVLNKCWREEDSAVVHCILSVLPKTSRFSLSAGFLSSQEKHAISELLQKLSTVTLQPERTGLQELAQLYSVELPS